MSADVLGNLRTEIIWTTCWESSLRSSFQFCGFWIVCLDGWANLLLEGLLLFC